MDSPQDRITKPYCRLLLMAGVSCHRYPLAFARQDDGSAHIETLPHGRFDLVVTDRGLVISKQRAADLDGLLYLLVKMALQSEAQHYEQAHRPQRHQGHQDVRRQIFDQELTLMGKVSSEWRQRLSWEIAEILARNPYRERPS